MSVIAPGDEGCSWFNLLRNSVWGSALDPRHSGTAPRPGPGQRPSTSPSERLSRHITARSRSATPRIWLGEGGSVTQRIELLRRTTVVHPMAQFVPCGKSLPIDSSLAGRRGYIDGAGFRSKRAATMKPTPNIRNNAVPGSGTLSVGGGVGSFGAWITTDVPW
jgi:hypothetical protein